MLIDAKSPRMQLVLCFITATSVGYLLLFLADMDNLVRYYLFWTTLSSIACNVIAT
jgi:hypothetical protein